MSRAETSGQHYADAKLIWDYHQVGHQLRPCRARAGTSRAGPAASTGSDRLLHRGVIAAIDGPSYRMRAHQQRADTLRKAAGGPR